VTVVGSSASSAFVGSRAVSGLSTLNIRRYTIGSTFEVALPFGLRFEADALYRRRYRINDPLTQGGTVFGAGIRFITIGPLRVTPEIRYSRWTSPEFLPTRNQVELLVGLGL
jgi:hypothetical protein